MSEQNRVDVYYQGLLARQTEARIAAQVAAQVQRQIDEEVRNFQQTVLGQAGTIATSEPIANIPSIPPPAESPAPRASGTPAKAPASRASVAPAPIAKAAPAKKEETEPSSSDDSDAPWGRTKDGRPKRKPGPAKGTPRAATPEPAPTAAAAKKGGRPKASAQGTEDEADAEAPKRDFLADIRAVVGDGQMSADQILSQIRANNWVPDSTKDPLGLIRYHLSTQKDQFEPVEGARGVYRLVPPRPAAGKKRGAHAAPEAASVPTDDVDRLLKNADIQVKGHGPNPFGP